MWAALGHILPIAVAGAVSSVPIMAVILLLLSPNKSRSPLAFLIGYVLGLVAILALFTALAYVLPVSRRQTDAAVGTALVVVGVAMIVIAIIAWRRRASAPADQMPKWLLTVGSMRAMSAFGFAAVLNVRPKALLLSAAAGLSLRADPLTGGELAFVIAAYTVVTASSVAAPVIASLVAPGSTEKQLVRARVWIATNSGIISVVIMLMIGVVIVGSGLTRF